MVEPVTSGSPRREAAHASHDSRVRRSSAPPSSGTLARHRVSAPAGDAPRPSAAVGALHRARRRSPPRSRLADRRSLFVGDRFWGMGAEDGSYPATGFHTRGEMGGFWTPPVKLLDGIWFKAGSSWLSAVDATPAAGATSGWTSAPTTASAITRTDFAPDGIRAGLIGLRLDSRHGEDGAARGRRALRADEGLPLGRDRPQPDDVQPPGHRAHVSGKNLRLPRAGHARPCTTETHDYAALVGSSLTPERHRARPRPPRPAGRRRCARPPARARRRTPPRCDDTAYGKGTGGQLSYDVHVPAGGTHRLVRDRRLRPRRRRGARGSRRALARPASACCARSSPPGARSRRTAGSSLPGDPLLAAQRRLEQAEPRRVGAGVAQPAGPRRPTPARPTRRPSGTVAKARWFGAGFPDYPWLFATDGEYTSFAARQQRPVRHRQGAPARAAGRQPGGQRPQRQGRARGDAGRAGLLRRQRRRRQHRRDGEVPLDRRRWCGAGPATTRSATRCTPSPSATCATSSATSTPTTTAGPRASATSRRPGWAPRSSTTPSTRSAGCATSPTSPPARATRATRRWAANKAAGLERASRRRGGTASDTRQYADSLNDPGNAQVFQRHWIGVTPAEVELKRPGRPDGPLASLAHARAARRAARGALATRARSGSSTPVRGTTSPPTTPRDRPATRPSRACRRCGRCSR